MIMPTRAGWSEASEASLITGETMKAMANSFVEDSY
jgi:hypothetical protein